MLLKFVVASLLLTSSVFAQFSETPGVAGGTKRVGYGFNSVLVPVFSAAPTTFGGATGSLYYSSSNDVLYISSGAGWSPVSSNTGEPFTMWNGAAFRIDVDATTTWSLGWHQTLDERWWLLGNTDSALSFGVEDAEFYIPLGNISDVPGGAGSGGLGAGSGSSSLHLNGDTLFVDGDEDTYLSGATDDTLNFALGGQAAAVFMDGTSAGGVGNLTVTGSITAGSFVGVNVANLHDSTRIVLPDSTLTTNAHGEFLIVGNLNDPETMWDRDAFRALSEGTSWQNELGHFPERYWIEADTVGIDTLRIRDMNDMSVWMTFAGAGNSPTTLSYIAAAANTSSLEFLDGILYLGFGVAGENWGLLTIDFLNDTGTYTFTADQYRLYGGIATRNDGAGYYGLDNSLGIANATVNAVDATRDPFGMPMPDGSGRLAQWWYVGTDDTGAESIFNPHANAIYDRDPWAGDMHAGGFDGRGGIWRHGRDGTQDQLWYNRTALSITADAFSYQQRWRNDKAGSEDLAWGNAVIYSGLGIVDGASAAGTNSPMALLGSDSGLYLLHAKANDNENGGKVLIDATRQCPYEKGDAVGVYAMSDGTDCGPYGNDLTAVGSPAYKSGDVSIPFSHAYSSMDRGTSTHLKRVGDTDFHDIKSVHTWFKSASASNPGDLSFLFALQDARSGNADLFSTYFNATTGTMVAWIADGATSDTPTFAVDLLDASWHHYAMVLIDNGGTNFLHMYVDGELAQSDLSINCTIGNIDTDSLFVGTSPGVGYQPTVAASFAGQIAPLAVSKDELTASEIRAIYNDGVKAMQVAGTTNLALAATDVDYIHANDGYVVLGDEDSLQIFIQGGTTIIEELRIASVGGNIQAAQVWIEPGTDSLSYAYLTTTSARVVQTDPNLLSAAQHRWTWKQPEAMQGGATIVDSSGVEGVFWNIDDALGAANNAGQGLVRLLAGTFPGFSADESYMTVEGSGHLSWVDGGTASHGVSITGDQVTLRDFRVSTTGGGGSGYKAVVNNTGSIGRYGIIENLWISSSDGDCIEFSTGGYYSRITNNNIWNCDDAFIRLVASGVRFADNQMQTAANYGIELGSGQGDNSIITGNYISGSGDDAVFINTADEDVVVDGNRFDGWTNECIDDNSGTSTSGDNDCT